VDCLYSRTSEPTVSRSEAVKRWDRRFRLSMSQVAAIFHSFKGSVFPSSPTDFAPAKERCSEKRYYRRRRGSYLAR
jgi:hypothetical protein